MGLSSLPTEVVQLITNYCRVEDVINLEGTCSHMKEILSARQVWVRQVKNLGRSRAPDLPFDYNIDTLSADDLKNIAVRAAKGDYNWSSAKPSPSAVAKLQFRTITVNNRYKLHLLPGGRHVILGTGSNVQFWDVTRMTLISQTPSFSSVLFADYKDEDNIIFVAWAGFGLQLQVWNLELSTQALEMKYTVSRFLDRPRVMLFDMERLIVISSNVVVIADYVQQLEIRLPIEPEQYGLVQDFRNIGAGNFLFCAVDSLNMLTVYVINFERAGITSDTIKEFNQHNSPIPFEQTILQTFSVGMFHPPHAFRSFLCKYDWEDDGSVEYHVLTGAGSIYSAKWTTLVRVVSEGVPDGEFRMTEKDLDTDLIARFLLNRHQLVSQRGRIVFVNGYGKRRIWSGVTIDDLEKSPNTIGELNDLEFSRYAPIEPPAGMVMDEYSGSIAFVTRAGSIVVCHYD